MTCHLFSNSIRHKRKDPDLFFMQMKVLNTRFPIIVARIFFINVISPPHFKLFYLKEMLEYCRFYFLEVKGEIMQIYCVASFAHIYKG